MQPFGLLRIVWLRNRKEWVIHTEAAVKQEEGLAHAEACETSQDFRDVGDKKGTEQERRGESTVERARTERWAGTADVRQEPACSFHSRPARPLLSR